MIRLYDTRRREKVEFTPIDAKNVRLYVCGPTVYDDAHIGNARPVIVFDLLFRLLRHTYGTEHVTYARNITDVDDKINLRAHERGITIRELTDGTNARFQAACAALGCLEPTVQPRATDHIEGMKAIIERLIARGVAYVAEEHVLFNVPAMASLAGVPRYGALARRTLDDMLAGARVDVAPYKRDAMDFVLWKPSRAAHEPGWPSPAGIATPGRPGWHIECSAMSMAELLEPFGGGLTCDDPTKNVFDIHGGGIDLTFPHHENEVAQSCCAFGTEVMANVWMHNGFLQVEGEKMSKSLGNFVTIDELLNTDKFGGRSWSGDVLRLAMMKTHYRQPIDWTVKALLEAEAELKKWTEIARDVEDHANRAGHEEVPDAPIDHMIRSISDDLNIWAGITELRGHVNEFRNGDVYAGRVLYHFLRFLGFSLPKVTESRPEIDSQFVSDLIEARLAARRAKNFAESDRIRDELLAKGIQLKDGKDPVTGEPITTWEMKR